MEIPLYKYHRYNTYLFELLIRQEFYCATHSELNDPFDLRFKITPEFLPDLHQFIIGTPHVAAFTETMTESEIGDIQLFMKMFLAYKDELTESLINHLQYRVTSFIAEKSDIDYRMWSHYTNSFRGVRMEFNFSEDENYLNGYIQPVNYDGPKIVNKFDELWSALWYKTDIWKDEKEYRYVQQYISRKEFDKSSLKEITFGINLNFDEIYGLMVLMHKLEYKCKYFQLQTIDDKLVPVEIAWDEIEGAIFELRNEAKKIFAGM